MGWFIPGQGHADVDMTCQKLSRIYYVIQDICFILHISSFLIQKNFVDMISHYKVIQVLSESTLFIHVHY